MKTPVRGFWQRQSCCKLPVYVESFGRPSRVINLSFWAARAVVCLRGCPSTTACLAGGRVDKRARFLSFKDTSVQLGVQSRTSAPRRCTGEQCPMTRACLRGFPGVSRLSGLCRDSSCGCPPGMANARGNQCQWGGHVRRSPR